MRILYDARKITLQPMGVGYVVKKLLEQLLTYKDLEMIALTKKGIKNVFDPPLSKNLIVHETDDDSEYFGLKRVFFEQINLLKIINFYKPDLLHLTNGFSVPFLLDKKRSRLKILLTIHDLIPLTPFCEYMSKTDRFVFKHFLSYSVGQADMIVTVSETTKRDVYRYFPIAKNVQTITNGMESLSQPIAEVEKNWPILKKKYKLENDFICYIGSFSPRKNILSLIKSYYLIYKKFPSYQLVLCGRFSNNPDVQKILYEIRKFTKEKNLENNIKIIGYLSPLEKSVLLTKAKFFAYLSLYEGFGLPVLESLSVGTPVLTSKQSAMEEIAQRYALYADPNNIDDITKKMIEILTFYSDYKKKAELAKFNLVPQYNWKKTGKLYIEQYLNLK